MKGITQREEGRRGSDRDNRRQQPNMSAIFDFSSLLTVILLLICTCAYLRDMRPTIFDGGKVR
jgi:hypothetical protein